MSLNSKHDSAGGRSGPNEALINYLGNPVMPPTNMDQRYTTGALTNAVRHAAHDAGITLKSVAVDDSEFPFLLGVVCHGSDCIKLKSALKAMPGYEYGGGMGNDVNS